MLAKINHNSTIFLLRNIQLFLMQFHHQHGSSMKVLVHSSGLISMGVESLFCMFLIWTCFHIAFLKVCDSYFFEQCMRVLYYMENVRHCNAIDRVAIYWGKKAYCMITFICISLTLRGCSSHFHVTIAIFICRVARILLFFGPVFY